jgi:hypothetical protein
MELRVNEVKLPEAISFNYAELKTAIAEKANEYAVAVYTEDQIKSAKTDRANLNKLKKALNDERIRQEKEYMKPFNDFKTKINELIGIIDKPVQLIDGQIKNYEEKQKEEKLQEIKELYKNTAHPEWLDFETVFDGNEKWLNASVKIGAIEKEIWDFIDKVEDGMQTLSQLPEYSFEAMETYKKTLNLNIAISKANELSDMAKRKAEMERLKAEARAKAEAEERAKAEAEMKAKAEAEATKTQIETKTVEEPAPAPAVEEPAPETKVQEKQWISFKALLSVQEAKTLKEFFDSRNIEFKAI